MQLFENSLRTPGRQLLVTKHRRVRLTENRSDASSRGKVQGLRRRHSHGGPELTVFPQYEDEMRGSSLLAGGGMNIFFFLIFSTKKKSKRDNESNN